MQTMIRRRIMRRFMRRLIRVCTVYHSSNSLLDTSAGSKWTYAKFRSSIVRSYGIRIVLTDREKNMVFFCFCLFVCLLLLIVLRWGFSCCFSLWGFVAACCETYFVFVLFNVLLLAWWVLSDISLMTEQWARYFVFLCFVTYRIRPNYRTVRFGFSIPRNTHLC